MTASELHRKLLYCGFDDMADYLRDSPFNRCIYNVIITHKPKRPIDTPILTIFNEVYYQCVRIGLDDDPGSNLEQRYLDEETEWLGSRDAALLVFSVVWGILRRKHYRSFNEDWFVSRFYPLIDDGFDEGSYQLLAHIIIKYTAGERLLPPNRFRPMPCPAKDLPAKPKIFWNKVTNQFSHKGVESLVSLYATIEQQQTFLNKLKTICTAKEAEKANLEKTREDINAGAYLRSSEDEEEYDEKLELTYKEELKELKEKYERLQKRHEQELFSQEYSFKREISELREMLERKKIDETRFYEPHAYLFSAAEMITHVTERFSKTAADEFSVMLYQLAVKHGYLDERICQMIDDIVPSVLKRESLHQTIEIPSAGQVNINPQNVHNHKSGKAES